MIIVRRVREDGQTAYQLMKGRRTNAKLATFGECVLFKIPRAQHRVGNFEDKRKLGCWIEVVLQTAERLVSTDQLVFKVSTITRRPTDRRWSLAMVRFIVGTSGQPVPGSRQRKIVAFARNAPEVPSAATACVPMLATEAEPRHTKIQAEEIDAHGSFEKCLGCRAYKGCK